ncbi:hypothetical protein GGR54DRAFT_103272 [Hypoxylon sp. NC1633]|nr:hypothetical protein GGR54DRAFT_103272 [Hypoxylon sp. NC1633]
MAPFRHRQIFCAIARDRNNGDFGDAEEIIDCLPFYDHDGPFYDQHYAQLPTAEPLSENMVRLVRSHLATLFFEHMAIGIQCTLKHRLAWTVNNAVQYCVRTFDRPCLPPKIFVPRSQITRDHLLEHADVHIAVYFDCLDDVLLRNKFSRFETGKLGRYIWRKWFQWHGGRPPFLGHQKFAKPIGLMGNGPRNIRNFLEFHRSLCDAVPIGLDQQALPTSRPSTRRSNQKRSQAETPRSYKDEGREMAHLYRAIVIVVDAQVLEYEEPEICRPVLPPRELFRGFAYQERQREWTVSQYSVLLLRTGDDAHLSSPISFQALYDSGEALPVNRPDCDDDGTNVVRVKIDAALNFVLDLIRRERELIPSIGLAAETEYREHSEACEKWVDGVIEHAGRVGIDTNCFTWEAVRRAQAALNGEAFDKDQIYGTWDNLVGVNLSMGFCDLPDEA